MVQGVKSRGVLMLFGLHQFEITEMLSFFETNSLVQSMSLKKLNLNRGDVLKLNTNAFIFPIMNDILNLSYAFCRLYNWLIASTSKSSLTLVVGLHCSLQH